MKNYRSKSRRGGKKFSRRRGKSRGKKLSTYRMSRGGIKL